MKTVSGYVVPAGAAIAFLDVVALLVGLRRADWIHEHLLVVLLVLGIAQVASLIAVTRAGLFRGTWVPLLNVVGLVLLLVVAGIIGAGARARAGDLCDGLRPRDVAQQIGATSPGYSVDVGASAVVCHYEKDGTELATRPFPVHSLFEDVFHHVR